MKIDLSRGFSLNQEIPSYLAVVLLLVLSVAVVWWTINEGEKIMEGAKNSKYFNQRIDTQPNLSGKPDMKDSNRN